jgi:hypothetical protein
MASINIPTYTTIISIRTTNPPLHHFWDNVGIIISTTNALLKNLP